MGTRAAAIDPMRLVKMAPAELHALLAGDQSIAAPWVRAAAERGLTAAQVRWGRMLLAAEGVPRDETSALAWFRTAARDGDAEAMNMVGRCHENGWGTPADPAMAVFWYRKAAAAGDSWGQYNLGHMLLDGNGVQANAEAAFAWYRRAADLVGRCLEQGWGTAKDPAAARPWYRASAEGGYFRGQYNWATVLVAEGKTSEAALWFARAAQGGPPEIQRAIETFGYNGG
jgi:TPR repeat protein